MSTDKPIINDWTKKTLVIDLTNALGETYHFEIEPEADAGSIPTRPTNDDTVLNMNMPLLDPDYKPISNVYHSPTQKKSKGKK